MARGKGWYCQDLEHGRGKRQLRSVRREGEVDVEAHDGLCVLLLGELDVSLL